MHTKITIDVDGRSHEVHEQSTTGRQIKELAHRDDGSVYRLEGELHHHIPDHEVVHVHGGERFVIVHEHHKGTVAMSGTNCTPP